MKEEQKEKRELKKAIKLKANKKKHKQPLEGAQRLKRGVSYSVIVLYSDTRDNAVSSGEKTTVGAQRLKRGISYSVIILQLFNVFILGDTRDNTVSSGEQTTIGAQRLKRGISYSVIILQLFNISVLGATKDNTVSSMEYKPRQK